MPTGLPLRVAGRAGEAPIRWATEMRRGKWLALVLLAMSCAPALTPSRVTDGPIRVFVYLGENNEATPGATVNVLDQHGGIAFTTKADRFGVATIPAEFDVAGNYIVAEFAPLLLSGAKIQLGRREYNLPLQPEPMVNRAVVPAHRSPN